MVAPVRLKLPLSRDDVLSLKAGDIVSLSGLLITGRDRVHRFLTDRPLPKESIPFDLEGTVLYHCGPIVRKTGEGHQIISAGPTTSMRVEMYEPAVIEHYGIRGIMGKGGMGPKTLEACKKFGCVYFHTIGGAAVYLAQRITKIRDVWKLDEFGPTEAMWLLEVQELPAFVTMDAHGNNLHQEIEDRSSEKFRELMKKTVQ